MAVTRDEVVKYCRRYANGIFVRTQVTEAEWKNVPFSELSLNAQSKYIEQWWEEDRLPYRIKEKGE